VDIGDQELTLPGKLEILKSWEGNPEQGGASGKECGGKKVSQPPRELRPDAGGIGPPVPGVRHFCDPTSKRPPHSSSANLTPISWAVSAVTSSALKD